jgi:acyl-CoA thioesterase YciA
VTRVGTSSVTVKVEVEAERLSPVGLIVSVTDAEVVYVGVDEHGNKMPIRIPRLENAPG